ncbi:MAG: 4a-hydroxytetrahydrobiopterin dehydratase [Chloroflexi bacterium]|nr:4a-hydroxytetrahydrobiopterin dehydratase [Chloroflexota bacterium]
MTEPLLTELLASLDGWTRGGGSITKTFVRKGWKDAIAFVDRIAKAAAEHDHHPDIHVEGYKKVRIVLTTHVAHGLSQADIDLARAIDELAG